MTMFCELPVITTRATPWRDLETERYGWWIDQGTRPLVEALQAALALSDEERAAMGARGRGLVERTYGWSRLAGQMAAVYEWLLVGGKAPACVI